MRVFLAGGTGLIGTALVHRLIARGDQPVILSRQASKAKLRDDFQKAEVVQGDPTSSGAWEVAVEGCEAVVNLAGTNLFSKRWGPEVKRQIRDSRVYSTENLVGAIRKAGQRPQTLVQGSAIGYYGPTGDEDLTESSPSGSDFMAVVCREWEDAAKPVEEMGLRLATIRTGIVLAKGAGALGVMAPIFKWLPGGAAPVGSGSNPLMPGRGQQWMSWIHLDDIVGIFLHAIDQQAARGPINGTSPQPVRNIEFSKELARVLRRPFLPFGPPDAVLKTVIGEVAQIVATGQKVLPNRAQELGYSFKFPELPAALKNIFRGEPAPGSKPESVATA